MNKKNQAWNTLRSSIKNRDLKRWFYEFKNGHPFLLNEEVDIICETRIDLRYLWMNDTQIQKLIKLRVEKMYRDKYPNSKKWTFPIF